MSDTKEWRVIEVEHSVEIPFDCLDQTPGGSNLGRAEFQVCICYKRGKVNEFFVYPRQQRRSDCWHYQGGSEWGFSICSHGDLPNPNVWQAGWCKEHKTQTLGIYVPTGSNRLIIDRYGLTFKREPEKGARA